MKVLHLVCELRPPTATLDCDWIRIQANPLQQRVICLHTHTCCQLSWVAASAAMTEGVGLNRTAVSIAAR